MQNGDGDTTVPDTKSQPDNYTPPFEPDPGRLVVVDELQLAEDLLRSWLLTYSVNAVGEEAPLRSLELAHGALATLSAAARRGTP